MAEDELLLLDAGGVLVNDILQSPWWLRFGHETGHDPDEVARYFFEELKPPLWRGEIGVDEFWRRLAAHLDHPDGWRGWNDELIATLHPLPAMKHAIEWARRGPVAVLSNQVADWLLPAFDRFGIGAHLRFALVSDQIHRLKPERAAFEAVFERWHGEPEGVLFVDDTEENLAAAAALGIRTLHADPAGAWVDAIGGPDAGPES